LATALVHFTAAAVSDRGRKRPSNEDAYAYSVENGIYLVCDGMGGAAAGEIASSLAVDEVMRSLAMRDPIAPLREEAEKAIFLANQAIYSRAQRNPNLKGMGTTLVSLLTEDRRVLIFNIGDSRAYRLRNCRLALPQRDHAGARDPGPGHTRHLRA